MTMKEIKLTIAFIFSSIFMLGGIFLITYSIIKLKNYWLIGLGLIIYIIFRIIDEKIIARIRYL